MTMGFGIQVDALGIEETIHGFSRVAATARNMRPALNKITEDMFKAINTNFTSQGRRGGGSWARVKEDTWRRKKNPLILQETQRLKWSVTKRRSRNMILEIDADSIQLSSSLPYAETHQYGDPDRKIPARPYIEFVRGDIARWSRIAETELERAFVRRRA
jgi:phage gpG-like protein